MSVDHTKVVFYSGFNAFKNVNVYDIAVDIDGTTVATGQSFTWSETIDVPEDSNYATIQFEANETTGFPRSSTPLRWQSYPAANRVFIDLNTDPFSNGAWEVFFLPVISGTTVTFQFTITNTTAGNLSFNPQTINIRYAIHSTEQ